MENLTSVGRTPSSITRTMSDPHAPVNKRNKDNHPTMRKSLSDVRHNSVTKNPRKDSEKENEPVEKQTDKQESSVKSESPPTYSGTVKGTNNIQSRPVSSGKTGTKEKRGVRARPTSLTDSKTSISSRTRRNVNSPRNDSSKSLSSSKTDVTKSVSSTRIETSKPQSSPRIEPSKSQNSPRVEAKNGVSGSYKSAVVNKLDKPEKSRASPVNIVRKSDDVKESRNRTISEGKDDIEEDISQIDDVRHFT